MTLYILSMGKEKHLVRAQNEEDARMLMVEKKQDPTWVDDDEAECTVIFSSGRKELLL